MNYDDEIRFIRHRYKVITLLVSARKINTKNKIQPQKAKTNKWNKVEIISNYY